MLSREENPEATFPPGTSVSDMSGTWWVARTKARQEKALARDLAARQVGYFLPMVERVKVIRGRKFRPMIPLFPSYVFVCGSDDSRLVALRGGRIAGTFQVTDQPTLIRELAHVQQALSSGADVALCPVARKGRRCRVTSGPFEGIEGIVVRRKGGRRLVLNVQGLGKAVDLEVDEGLLEATDR